MVVCTVFESSASSRNSNSSSLCIEWAIYAIGTSILDVARDALFALAVALDLVLVPSGSLG